MIYEFYVLKDYTLQKNYFRGNLYKISNVLNSLFETSFIRNAILNLDINDETS